MLRLFSLMPLSQMCDRVSVKRDAFLAAVSCLKLLIEAWRCFPETWGCCSYALIYGFSSRSSCLSTTFISSTSLSALPDFKHFTSLFSALFLHFASCISFWGMPPRLYQVELFPGYRQQRDVSVWRRSADTEAGGGLNISEPFYWADENTGTPKNTQGELTGT